MESIRTVNRDDIAERFAPYALSSGKGSHVLHNNPQAQSLKKTKKALGPATSRHSPSSARLLPQTSIQAGYGMEPISSVSSGAEPRGGLVEPQVLEPVEIAPADQMFTGKGHGIMEEYVEGRNGGHLPHLVQVGGRRWISNEGNLITSHTMKNPSALPAFFISTYLESNKNFLLSTMPPLQNHEDVQEVEAKAGTLDSKVLA